MLRKPLVLLMIAMLTAFCACGALAENEWICPECGTENPGSSRFCSECATPQRTDEVIVEAHDNAWVCSLCHETCPDGAKFCRSCATQHQETDERAVLIPETPVEEIQFKPAEVQTFSLNFRKKEEKLSIDFEAPVDGKYRVST